MKMRHRQTPFGSVVRTTWSADPHHPAWQAETPPTPATCPDAFFFDQEPAYPCRPPRGSYLAPHHTLSRTQVRKRLSRAGLRGAALKRTVDLVKTGSPGYGAGFLRGSMQLALGWELEGLKRAVGQQLARKLVRFVSTRWVVRDEFWDLAGSAAFAQLVGRMRSRLPVRPTTDAAREPVGTDNVLETP